MWITTDAQATAFELIAGDVEGIRTAFIVPAIPDGAPPRVREALARRRLLDTGGSDIEQVTEQPARRHP